MYCIFQAYFKSSAWVLATTTVVFDKITDSITVIIKYDMTSFMLGKKERRYEAFILIL